MGGEDLALLLKQCLERGDAASWEQFIKLAQPAIAAGVIGTLSHGAGVSRELADDLIQETFLKICADDFRILRQFRSASESKALRAYLKVIAANLAADHFRSAAAKQAVNLDDVALRLGVEDRTHEFLEHDVLMEHVERCLAGVDSRNHRIFWLYHAEGLRPKEIAALPDLGLRTGGVENIVYKLTLKVKNCLHRAGVLDLAIIREGSQR